MLQASILQICKIQHISYLAIHRLIGKLVAVIIVANCQFFQFQCSHVDSDSPTLMPQCSLHLLHLVFLLACQLIFHLTAYWCANNRTKELLDHLVSMFSYPLSETHISYPIVTSSPITAASTGLLIYLYGGSTLIATNKTDGSVGS